MTNRDPHTSLKNTVLKNLIAEGLQIVLTKLQWSKDEIAHSLHVSPNTFSTSGIQTTDFLNMIGFKRSDCSFINIRECYVKWVDDNFDVVNFGERFNVAFANLKAAQMDLEQCGFFIEQSQGLGFFFGKSSNIQRIDLSMNGDGHNSRSSRQLKIIEDEYFFFSLTWIETADQKGWTVHYKAKHLPISSEINSALNFLGLKSFDNCPEFDFEECYWRSLLFRSNPNNPHSNNTEMVHRWFDAHAKLFSFGVKKLLNANNEIEQCGLSFLPFIKPKIRLNTDIEKKVQRPSKLSKQEENFDIAISFAGTERKDAEQLATILRDSGYSVFYDDFYKEFLWGKNLVDTFDEIYRKRSKYCVMFISHQYNERMWTNHERQSAQARALNEKGKEYILPIKVDETELMGMPPTIGHVPLSMGIDKIADLLIEKLKKSK